MRTSVRSVLAAACAALFATACNGTETAPAPPADDVESRAQAVIDRSLAEPLAVGLSVAIGRGGEVVFETGAGSADLELDVPATAETSFRIGSVTKQFTAAGIMLLVERGQLSLDDDLGDYVPAFDTGGRAVTIRQLLNHTSGIPNYTAQPGFIATGWLADTTDEELLAVVKDVPFDFEPGESWRYSNTGYYLLGMVIEAVDGRDYADFVQEEFAEPLGLTTLRYGDERPIIPGRAQGYAIDPQTRELVNDQRLSMNAPGAAGALIASAGDLVRWQIALTTGKVVSEESFDQMVNSNVATGQGEARYGFGLGVDTRDGKRRVSHTGGIPGFNSVLTWLPEEDLHIAVISNSEGLPALSVGDLLDTALTSGEPPAPARTEPDPRSEEAVRRMIDELIRGEPDYDLLSPPMAEVTRSQLAGLQSMLVPLGPIQSVTFDRVTLSGLDVYDVEFANGGVLFSVRLDDEGVTTAAAMGPKPTPPPSEDQRMAAFQRADANSDDQLDKDEYLVLLTELGFAAQLDTLFEQRDVNQDGFITAAEYEKPI